MYFPSQPSKRPLADALGGIALAIVCCYCLFYFPEIIRLEHHLNYAMLGNLILLGVPVLLFGWLEQQKA